MTGIEFEVSLKGRGRRQEDGVIRLRETVTASDDVAAAEAAKIQAAARWPHRGRETWHALAVEAIGGSNGG